LKRGEHHRHADTIRGRKTIGTKRWLPRSHKENVERKRQGYILQEGTAGDGVRTNDREKSATTLREINLGVSSKGQGK